MGGGRGAEGAGEEYQVRTSRRREGNGNGKENASLWINTKASVYMCKFRIRVVGAVFSETLLQKADGALQFPPPRGGRKGEVTIHH